VNGRLLVDEESYRSTVVHLVLEMVCGQVAVQRTIFGIKADSNGVMDMCVGNGWWCELLDAGLRARSHEIGDGRADKI